MSGQSSVGDTWAIYEKMYTIRAVEQHLLYLFDQGLLPGTVHTCLGQEGCAVGVVGALRIDHDIVVSNHRGHGHFLVHSGFNIRGLIGEVLGRDAGVCHGVGGTQQLYTPTFLSIGVQGSLVPSAVGMAFAEKIKGSDVVVCAFVGDGTMGQGVIYESLNIASKWELPFLLVVEANGYAQTTPTHVQHAGRLIDRAAPFGISSTELDVMNVVELKQTAEEIVDEVRTTSRPHFLVLNTYRLGPHSKGDDVRDQEEIDKHSEIDPLRVLNAELTAIDGQRISELESRIRGEIEVIASDLLAAQPASPIGLLN